MSLTYFFLSKKAKVISISARMSSSYSVTALPARSSLRVACGRTLPSYMGTVWVTPSPESTTIPVVLPVAYRESTA
jgi:hypothetical protein